jgi:hypothetical protein
MGSWCAVYWSAPTGRRASRRGPAAEEVALLKQGTTTATAEADRPAGLVLVGIFALIAGVYFLKRRKWAYYVVLIFIALGFLSSLLRFVSGDTGQIIGLALTGWVIWYLWFKREVKSLFVD